MEGGKTAEHEIRKRQRGEEVGKKEAGKKDEGYEDEEEKERRRQ